MHRCKSNPDFKCYNDFDGDCSPPIMYRQVSGLNFDVFINEMSEYQTLIQKTQIFDFWNDKWTLQNKFNQQASLIEKISVKRVFSE